MSEQRRVYPIQECDGDSRFTFGLVIDVAELLERHGYPAGTGHDLVELQQVLYRFMYRAGGR